MPFGDPDYYANNALLVKAVGHFGTSGTTVDIWSCGWRFPVDDSFSIEHAQLDSLLATIAPAVSAFHQNANTGGGTNTFLDKLTAAIIGKDGRYFGSQQETREHVYATPVGAAQTPTHPFSTALCYTHFSFFPRGKASKGRVYWPATALAINQATGATGAPALAGPVYQTLVNSMNQAVDGIADVSSLGVLGVKTTELPGGSPARTGLVLAIGVGQAPDTQRRRDNKVLELHTSLPVQFHTSDGVLLQELSRDRLGNRD